MRKKITKNLIIAVLFIMIIFIFGLGTCLKCKGDFIDAVKLHNFVESKEIIEHSIQSNFKSKNNWINFNGLFQRIIGTTIVRDSGGTDVYKLDNGYLMYNLNQQNMKEYAESIFELYKLVKDKDADFLYVQQPFKIESDETMPLGSKEYGNDNADELIMLLNEGNIPNLDIRDVIKKENLNYDELYFKTDHHWKPETAFWAAGEIIAYINKEYNRCDNIDYDVLKLDNYKVKTYEEWFLGSLGKRTGAWYGGVDDFSVVLPKFDTNFNFYAESKGGHIERKGEFEDVMFKWDYIDKKNYFNINTYAGYLGGDYAVTSIMNNRIDSTEKLLILKDSYSNAMIPYLSMAFKNVTAVDLRHYKETTIADYIEKNQFDMVIVAYNPSAFTEEQFGFMEIIQ